MTALLKQMGEDQPPQGQTVSAEMTPVRGSRPAVVVPEMPGTQEKQARPGVLAQQGGAGSNVTQEWMANNSLSPAQHLGSTSVDQEVAELRRKNQAMEGALKDVLTMGEGAGTLTRLMQARGHEGVVGMITSGACCPLGHNESPAAPQCKEQAGVVGSKEWGWQEGGGEQGRAEWGLGDRATAGECGWWLC